MDTIPPVVLSSSPKNFSTHFDEREIKINFDEYIKLKNINQNLIISPPMENMPDLLPMGMARKNIIIKLKDTLKPNTTYSFNFGESIIDNNEGNVLPQFKYVFSTGDFIDSLKVTGTIRSAGQLNPDNFVSVMLYDAETFTDSTAYREKPLYVTNTLDSLTSFSLENIKEGTYYLIALKDKNNNYKFDPAQEKIAFIEEPITLPTAQTFDLNLFKSEEKFKASRPSQISENKWYLPYSGTIDSLSISIRDGEQTIPHTYTFLQNKDSLQLWFPKIEADSLLVEVENQEFSEVFTIRPRTKMKSIDTLSVSAKQTSTLDLRDLFTLQTTTPVASVEEGLISIIDKDSLPVTYTTQNLIKEQKLLFDFEKKELDTYSVSLLPGAITDFFGHQNDSLFYQVKTKEKTDYGNLTVVLDGVKRFPVILELLDNKENVLVTAYSKEETKIIFELLPPKIYLMRLIYDDNQNGKWDSGYYFDRRQPEEVIYYPEEIDVRANWDIEQTFNL